MKHAYRIIDPATGLPTETPSYSDMPSAGAPLKSAGPIGSLSCDALVSPSSFMKTEGHKFTFYGGQDIVAGKPHWPHHLRLVMDRQAAFHLVRDVIAQLENDCGADVRLAVVGEIVSEAEDDFQWANTKM